MRKLQATKELKFCAAHRLLGYIGQCRNIHGHNYRVLITLERRRLNKEQQPLDELGMVMDFSIIKAELQKWINDFLDHAVLINKKDSELINFATRENMKFYEMDSNATAEHLCLLIANKAKEIFGSNEEDYSFDGIIIRKVVVYETETCFSEVVYD